MVKTEISKPIENWRTMIDFITAKTMLMMIDHDIGTRINIKPVHFFHSQTRKLEMFMSTMNNHNAIIRIFFSFFYLVILLYGV